MKKALDVSDRKVTPRFVQTTPCQFYLKKDIPQKQEADPEGELVLEASPKDAKRRQRFFRPRHGIRRR